MHRKKSDAGQNHNEPNIKNMIGDQKEFARDSETMPKNWEKRPIGKICKKKSFDAVNISNKCMTEVKGW